MGGGLVRLNHSLAHLNIWGCSTLRGQNMVFRKSRFEWVRFHRLISVISRPKFTKLFLYNVGKIVVQNVLVRFRTSSEDICRWSLNSSKIGPNFACYWPLKFFSGRPLKFWTSIIKLGLVLITVQNFALIGWHISEVSCWKKIVFFFKIKNICSKVLPKTIVSGWTRNYNV